MSKTTIPTGGLASDSVTTAKIADDAVTAAKAGFSAGKILQVQSADFTSGATTVSAASFGATEVTDQITPSAASSKVLVMGKIMFGSSSSARNFIQLRRGDTKIGNSPAAGSRQEVIGVGTSNAVNDVCTVNFHYIDSPNTTSATTYKVFGCREGSGAFRLNRSENDTDDATVSRGTSVITVMEILD